MSNKPDKKQIKSNIKQTQQIDSRLQAALAGEREELAQLRRAADQFLNARIQATLETIDVEMLTQGKQKIRVSYLRSAGIKNMWHLSKMSRQQIEALDGIGAQGAAAIYDSRMLTGAVERFPAAYPTYILALVPGSPSFFLLVSLSLQNQGLQFF